MSQEFPILKELLADEITFVRKQLADALRENKTGQFVWRESQFAGATRDPLLRELQAAGWTYSQNSDYNGRYYNIFPNSKIVASITFEKGGRGAENWLPSVADVLAEVMPEVREQLGKRLRDGQTGEFIARDDVFPGSTFTVAANELLKAGWRYSQNSDYSGRYYTILPHQNSLAEFARSSESGEDALPTVQKVLNEALPKVRAELREALEESQTKPFTFARAKFVGATEAILINELRARGWTVSYDNERLAISANQQFVKGQELTEAEQLPSANGVASEVLPRMRAKLAAALKAAETAPLVYKRSNFTPVTEAILIAELRKEGWNVQGDDNNGLIISPNNNFVKQPPEPEIDKFPTPEECRTQRLGATRYKLAQKMRESERHEFKWPLRDFPDDTSVTLLGELLECDWDYELVAATDTDPVSYLIRPKPM